MFYITMYHLKWFEAWSLQLSTRNTCVAPHWTFLAQLLQYVYIISGEELTRLGKDYLKFLFGKGKSVRLKRAMNKWKRFFQSWNEMKEEDPFWLEKEIINTRTWFDSPEKYKEIFRSVWSSNGNSNLSPAGINFLVRTWHYWFYIGASKTFQIPWRKRPLM